MERAAAYTMRQTVAIGLGLTGVVFGVPLATLGLLRAARAAWPAADKGVIFAVGYSLAVVAIAAGFLILPRFASFEPVVVGNRTRMAALCFGASIVTVYIAGFWSLVVAWGAPPNSDGTTSGHEGLALIVIGVATVVLAPVLEELWSRGLLYRFLRSSLPPLSPTPAGRTGIGRLLSRAPSILITSVVFAFAHVVVAPDLARLVATIPVGVALTIAYEVTARLWVPILSHAMINSLAFANSTAADSNASLWVFVAMVTLIAVLSVITGVRSSDA